ncbi:MAG: hypothetical protein R3A45_07565 [Bdellovibrionota bacterium]
MHSILHFFAPALLSITSTEYLALANDIITREFPVLAPNFASTLEQPETKTIIKEIGKCIVLPYAEILKALHKESLDKIVHHLAFNPEQKGSHKHTNNSGLTYQNQTCP